MQSVTLWFVILASIAGSPKVFAGPTWKRGVTIPVVAEGATCNTGTDKIGLTGNNQILSCQSGSWRRDPATACAAGQTWTGGACQSISNYGTRTGLQGVFYPLRGRTISCMASWMGGTATASVDANGNLNLFMGGVNCGAAPTCTAGGSVVTLTPAGIVHTDSGGNQCAASWPAT